MKFGCPQVLISGLENRICQKEDNRICKKEDIIIICKMEEKVHILMKREETMASVVFGTMASAPLNFVSFYMKNLQTAGIKKGVETLLHVGFFTRSLNLQEEAFNTKKKTSLHSSPEVKTEDNKKREKKV